MEPRCSHENDRRQFLAQAGGGAGMLACSAMVSASSSAESAARAQTDIAPRAKRVIWLFMHGGPSHVDLFDPKPALTRFAGQPLPESFGNVMTRRDVAKNPLLAPLRPFRRRGQSGLEISDFLPHIAEHADDLCVIRSLHGDSVNHPQSVYQMNTGSILMGSPSVGSWVAYGLGSENENMPSFVVLPHPGGGLKGGPPAWGNGYLSASYQGVTMRPGASPILDLKPQAGVTPAQQRRNLQLIQSFNQRHLERRDNEDQLSARIKAYELAFRMQAEAPALVDISGESQHTLSMYGVDQAETSDFGRRCLLARRMVENGVRFVQLYSGDRNGWDAHSDVDKNHTQHCRRTDKPIAGLLTDLKQRGLLENTLVIWGGEFGRMPMSEQGRGRDHNPWGYCAWLAGAGVAGGQAYGATDDIGLRAQTNKVSVNDFHATILHLLGVDHRQLTYFHNGLDKRLTGPDEADVVHELIG
ncbi:MAG: DUF1501 domain-containing protein [Fuerstiella sp.]|nr:DUF1501 domain-containing protein [Fuerstiella sp.]MCP4512275.1 DUF1501 domain-containing protein [Fuerstiella sp.]MDG2128743.1 DUF1501 domain-containing protein [Fuerstiella sp.]